MQVFNHPKPRLNWIFLVCSLWLSLPVFAEENCVNLDQILNLLQKKVAQTKIIDLVQKNRVDFKMDQTTSKKLFNFGANDDLFDAIEKNLCEPPLRITFPIPRARVGKIIRVEGKAKEITGRYLWIFAHVEGLEVWWPQRGRIKIKPDGSWRQGANLGKPQDVGFDFEIMAIWVNEETNQQLVNYITDGESTGSYPGMPLPEGEPRAAIMVHKISH